MWIDQQALGAHGGLGAMKAMLLAGGMSTRLYPLTRRVPKPLVPIAGEPNAVHVIRYLKSFGYDEIAINVHYLAGMIRHALGDGSSYGVHLTYLDEPELTGSAGALKSLESFFTEPFVVVGCDDLTNFDLGALVAFHRTRGAIATIGLVEAEVVDQYGVVILGDDGKIVDFQEKPARGTERSKLVNTGIYAFDPAIFKHIPPNTFYDFGKQVFPELQQQQAPFYGVVDRNAYWVDIGTIGEYRRATRDVLDGRIRLPGERIEGIPSSASVASGVQVSGRVRIGEDVVLGHDVRIAGPSVIGDGVRIGDGAIIESSIVWDGAQIGAGARLRDAIVGIHTTIGDGTNVTDDVVADTESAEAGTH